MGLITDGMITKLLRNKAKKILNSALVHMV